MSRASQGDWELCASLGSARSQSANWEAAGAEKMSHINVTEVFGFTKQSLP